MSSLQLKITFNSLTPPEAMPFPSSLPGWTFRRKKKKRPAIDLRKLVARNAYIRAQNWVQDQTERGKAAREARDAQDLLDQEARAVERKEKARIAQAAAQERIKQKGKKLFEFALLSMEDKMLARDLELAERLAEQWEAEELPYSEDLYHHFMGKLEDAEEEDANDTMRSNGSTSARGKSRKSDTNDTKDGSQAKDAGRERGGGLQKSMLALIKKAIKPR